MLLLDVNVLIYAFREDSDFHAKARQWLEELVNSGRPYGLADQVLSGFLRIVTHPAVFDPPAPLEAALEFAQVLRSQPACLQVMPGPRHWEIFTRLCRETQATGNLIPDA